MYVWVAALVLVAADLVVRRPTHHNAALGVFFGFQVTDFDRLLGFFSLCHSKSINERGSIVEK